MNNKQQIAVVVGITALVIIGVFPPWLSIQPGQAPATMGNAPLWRPPIASHAQKVDFLGFRFELDKAVHANEIDWSTLAAQALIICLLTTGVVVSLGLSTQKHSATTITTGVVGRNS